MYRHWKLMVALLLSGVLVWGLRTASSPKLLYRVRPDPEPPALVTASEPGVEVRGRVRWRGARPVVPTMRRPMSPYFPRPDSQTANVLAPVISTERGLADVFVVLEGKGAGQIPWRHPAVRLEWREYDGAITSAGAGHGRFALVHAGDEAEFVARTANNHSTQARGADFFTLQAPVPDKPAKRVLNQPGMVEISSGGWFYWAQFRLWVSRHGGCAITNDNGEFSIPGVPPGEYELLAIRANWNVRELEGDPEFPVPVRVRFQPDVVLRKTIKVDDKGISPVEFEMTDTLFKKPGN